MVVDMKSMCKHKPKVREKPFLYKKFIKLGKKWDYVYIKVHFAMKT